MQAKNKQTNWDISLEAFLAALQHGVIVLDANQDIVHINPAAREIFDLGETSCIGQPLADMIKRPELEKLISLLDEPTVQSNRTNIPVGEDGLYSAAAVQLDGGGIAISLHDVSRWNQMDRIKSDFISTVSHDLRTPLTSIMGYAELIERIGPINDQQRSFIQRIQTNAANIARLLEDLVRLGRFETGYDPNRERLDLSDIADQAIQNVSAHNKKKNIHFEVNFEEHFPFILGNSDQILQMFACLLDNAIKYSPPESMVRITGATAEERLLVQVSDTGIGIPEDEKAHIFDRFYRGSNIDETEPGNGLGLTIVKTVVHNHGGRIRVDSSLDSGTKVTIALPALGP
jgi:two-component system, OmpR family, phosphate regulon sensor histidine kinase PhoR